MAKLFVITGPSGVGKGTLLNRLVAHFDEVIYSISVTTRKPRQGEQNGVNYFFISQEEFQKAQKAGEFLEWAEYSGNFYGTKKTFVENALLQGKSVVLEIETAGAMQVLAKKNDAISIFILPPTFEELEKRLRGRKTEDEISVINRLNQAKLELSHLEKYKYKVINNEVETALKELIQIFEKELS